MITRSARATLAAAVIVAAPFLAYSQSPAQPKPGCEAPVWGTELTSFATRIEAYVVLRHELELEVSRQTAVVNPTGFGGTRRALAGRIRAARAQAKQGDLLTPALGLEIQKSLRREIDAHAWKVIMDDNPGEFPSQVNDEYREGKPLSTMPPNVLDALPRLPDDIEYHFVERHLILLDMRANVILDRIPFAIRYSDAVNGCR